MHILHPSPLVSCRKKKPYKIWNSNFLLHCFEKFATFKLFAPLEGRNMQIAVYPLDIIGSRRKCAYCLHLHLFPAGAGAYCKISLESINMQMQSKKKRDAVSTIKLFAPLLWKIRHIQTFCSPRGTQNADCCVSLRYPQEPPLMRLLLASPLVSRRSRCILQDLLRVYKYANAVQKKEGRSFDIQTFCSPVLKNSPHSNFLLP